MSANTSSFKNLEQLFATVRNFQTPALLWYSAAGERIELSGRVLDNWVSKSANFLVDECDLESGSPVDVPMGVHWRSLVIALAALRVGATISFEVDSADVLFSFDSTVVEASDAEYPVIVDRGSLAPRFMGAVPAGALDFCAEVRVFGDVYSGFETPVPSRVAMGGLSYSALLEAVSTQIIALSEELGSASAVQFTAPAVLTADYLIQVLAAVAMGRGVVILDPTIQWDQAKVEQILAQERAVPLVS